MAGVFNHVGIPTDAVQVEEHYLAEFKVFASGFETSPYGVEWLGFRCLKLQVLAAV